MQDKRTKHFESKDNSIIGQSPRHLPTEKSQSTAHGTVRKNEQSHQQDGQITGGPSFEDSKFLMESSIAQQSISMPHQSRFTENDDNEGEVDRARAMHNIPENNSLYHESQDILEGHRHYHQSPPDSMGIRTGQQRIMPHGGIDIIASRSTGAQNQMDSIIENSTRDGKRKKDKSANRVAFPIAKKTIDNIIYPVQTKRGLKWGKRKDQN